jgi:hypothetical protein
MINTNQAQKEIEMDAAWAQHRNPSNRKIPTEREVWEREERRRNKGKA